MTSADERETRASAPTAAPFAMAMAGRRPRVMLVPGGHGGPTSYLGLLGRSLEAVGWEVGAGSVHDLWRLGHRGAGTVVHLHWLEFIAGADTDRLAGPVRTLARGARLVAALLWLRARGVAVVWTVHNLVPHEPLRPGYERRLSAAVLATCDRAIAHSSYARSRIAEAYGHAHKVRVIPHGNYLGAFPPAGPGDRARLRGSWNADEDAFVFLAFGQVRPYKQLAGLIEALSEMDAPHLRLVIAGRPVVAAEARRLRAAAAADPRVFLELRQIEDSEVAALHAAADAGVIAYRDVFSSGALLLALSLGLPVAAPAVGTAAEVARPPALESFEPGDLTGALRRLSAPHPPRAQRRRAAEEIAARYPWSQVARSTAAVYREALRGGRRPRQSDRRR